MPCLGGGIFTIYTINHDPTRGLVIDGMVSSEFADGHIRALIDDSEVKLEAIDTGDTEGVYRIYIPRGDTGDLRVELMVDGSWYQLTMEYTKTARIGALKYDYRVIKGRTIVIPERNSLIIADFKVQRIIIREILFFLQNLFSNKHSIRFNIIKTLAVEAVRLLALVGISRGPSGVWLFSDRSISGGDNSEVLFRHVSDIGDSDVRPYFAVNKDSEAFKRLKGAGYKVVPFKSLRHLYLSIVSEMLLPSHLDMMYLYPWLGVWQKYAGLTQYDIAHTQHGIVLNDLSGYIGKYKKNADIILSACRWEQGQLLTGSYGYTADQLPVTGLPRYDELVDTSKNEKIISLFPTWRPWLAGEQRDGLRSYSDKFSQSEYFQFYQKLITDKRIQDALSGSKYTLRYYIHPNHIANAKDFSSKSDWVEIMDFPYDFNKMFSETNLFITDYSNTLFDVAYLGKPALYTQFDRGEFFGNHSAISNQIFDYDKQGFGPVYTDYDSAVRGIVGYINGGVSIEDVYSKRIDAFFTYRDTNSSRRAYKLLRQHFLKQRSTS